MYTRILKDPDCSDSISVHGSRLCEVPLAPRKNDEELPDSYAIHVMKIATGEIVEDPTASYKPITGEAFIRRFKGGDALVERLKAGESINTDGLLKIGSGFPPSGRRRK